MKLVIEMKRLPDTELEVMKALWASGPDTPRSALETALEGFCWASNTVNTYLTRLVEKGFVAVRREGKTRQPVPQLSPTLPGSPGQKWPGGAGSGRSAGSVG